MMLNNKELNLRFKIAILVNTIFTLIEFAIGVMSGSLALISDACQNLSDVTSLIISFIAQKIALKNANVNKTFGYGRITVLSALVNVLLLLVIAIYILSEVYKKFYEPEIIQADLVTITSLFGIIINGSVALMFLKYKEDLNVKSALVNMLFDAIASLAALVSGIIIMLTNNTLIDLFISLLISVMLFFSIYDILKKIVNILLEGTPNHLNILQIKKDVENLSHVKKIEHIHVWCITPFNVCLTANIFIDEINLNRYVEIVKEVKFLLKDKFKIEHITIEISILQDKLSSVNYNQCFLSTYND